MPDLPEWNRSGGQVSVKVYGAVGDGVTDDTAAITAAIESLRSPIAAQDGGTLSFDRAQYLTNGLVCEQLSGIEFAGWGRGATTLVGSASCQVVLDMHSSAGSGIGNTRFVVRDMTISAHNAATNAIALRVWNGLHYRLEGLYLEGKGAALSIQGSGNATILDCEGHMSMQANAQAACWVGVGNSAPHANDGTLTASGPVEFIGCQFTCDNATVNAPAVVVEGSTISTLGGVGSFSIKFSTCTFNIEGGAADGTVLVDGSSTTATFDHCHTESNWNATSTGGDYVVGKYVKPAYFMTDGWDGDGNGNTANAPGPSSGTFTATADTSGTSGTVTLTGITGQVQIGQMIYHSGAANANGFNWPTTITGYNPATGVATLSQPLNGTGAAGTSVIGAYRMPYGVQVYSCNCLIVRGGHYPGYFGGSVRFEAGFPAAGDFALVDGANPIGGQGLMISDANGIVDSTKTGPWRYTHIATTAGQDVASTWRVVREARVQLDAAAVTGAGTFPLGATLDPVAADPHTAAAYSYLDPTWHAVNGRNTRYRLVTVTRVNGTAPGVNFTPGLAAASGAPAGGAGVVTQNNGSFVSGSTGGLAVNAPAAGSPTPRVGSEFAPPAAGDYAIAVTVSGAMAANSAVTIVAQLQVHNV